MAKTAILGLLALLPNVALAGTADNITHAACVAHLATQTATTGSKVVRSPGYEAGWEKCAAFEAQYKADQVAAISAAAATRAAAEAARDVAAQERLNQ